MNSRDLAEKFGYIGPTLGYDEKSDGWVIGEGAGAVVLKSYDTVQQGEDRIYAVIDAINFTQQENNLETPNASCINKVCQQALLNASVSNTDINYLEVVGGFMLTEALHISIRSSQ